MRKLIIILIFSFFVQNLSGQQSKYCLGPLKLTCLSGEYKFESLYRSREDISPSIFEQQKNYAFNHSFLLNAKSYVWHPSFMVFDAELEYSPETNRSNYLVSPNRSENRTMKKIDLRTLFFQDKPVTLGLHTNLNESYQNRENLTNIRSKNKQWGALFSSKKVLPFSLKYDQGVWDQEEISSGRKSRDEFSTFEARLSKSFTKQDDNKLIYTYNNFMRENMNEYRVTNWYNRVALLNDIYLDSEKKHKFKSMISYIDQKGNQEYKRLQAMERLRFKLPKNFNLSAIYRYYKINQPTQGMTQHGGIVNLDHQLYESLNTTIFTEYNYINHTAYLEKNAKVGFSVRYNKKIPFGHLTLAYNYSLRHIDMTSESVINNVINEEYLIDDAQVSFLRSPYIDVNSIVVKDETGTIIYMQDFDYVIVEHASYVEIRRVPGGQIANLQTAYVDYVAIQPGTYEYDGQNTNFSASVHLFKQLIEVYYRRATQDYYNIQKTNFLTLNYITQNIYGGVIKIGPLKGGVEYDKYNSSIVPYHMWKYFLEFQIKIKRRLLVALNANKRDEFMYVNRITHTYNDINLRLSYRIRNNSNIMLQSGYRQQIGSGIDLNLLIGRLEYSTMFRKIYFSVGLEVYKRDYLNNIINFNGGFIRLSRKF